jgi:carboxypeptidase Taq
MGAKSILGVACGRIGSREVSASLCYTERMTTKTEGSNANADITFVYEKLREIELLSNVAALLQYDQQTRLPERGAVRRAEHLEMLSAMIHARQTAPEVLSRVDRMAEHLAALPDGDDVNIREVKKDLDKKRKLPPEFVAERARVESETQSVWERAKPSGDFAAVTPHLERMFSLARQQAEYLGFKGRLYDGLLDQYEPGATLASMKPLLLNLGKELAELIPAIREKFPAVSPPSGKYPVDAQRRLSQRIARDCGFDLARGCIDEVSHPMMTTLGPHDHRVTTRYDEADYQEGLTSVIHEIGHGLYEQGLPPEFSGRPLGESVSLGIHESQSRIWENVVARSRPFSVYLHRLLGEYLPTEQSVTTPEIVWRQLNNVKPSLIRIQADEVTYSQHIIIRTLLEEEVINGDLPVRDLPGRWAELYRQYLGVEPKNDTEGVLQDVHWYCGLVGYFPTYVLGNLYGAAMMEIAREALPTLDTDIEQGVFLPLREWLRSNVHTFGRRYAPLELVSRMTGKPFSSKPFLNYITKKFGV